LSAVGEVIALGAEVVAEVVADVVAEVNIAVTSVRFKLIYFKELYNSCIGISKPCAAILPYN
jgi:hypothetical protein